MEVFKKGREIIRIRRVFGIYRVYIRVGRGVFNFGNYFIEEVESCVWE